MKAVSPPRDAVVCDYSLDEMRRVYNRKFPHKIPDFERFLSLLALSVEIVSTPEETGEGMRDEQKIRDLNDRPIYLAALVARVDGILTGDKEKVCKCTQKYMLRPVASKTKNPGFIPSPLYSCEVEPDTRVELVTCRLRKSFLAPVSNPVNHPVMNTVYFLYKLIHLCPFRISNLVLEDGIDLLVGDAEIPHRDGR
jgi:hypothetical protein